MSKILFKPYNNNNNNNNNKLTNYCYYYWYSWKSRLPSTPRIVWTRLLQEGHAVCFVSSILLVAKWNSNVLSQIVMILFLFCLARGISELFRDLKCWCDWAGKQSRSKLGLGRAKMWKKALTWLLGRGWVVFMCCCFSVLHYYAMRWSMTDT